MSRLVSLLASITALALLMLLAQASNNTNMLARYYWWLAGLNSLVALGLLGLITTEILRLRKQLKARVFGATLTLRLVLMFTAITVLPGLLVYTASLRFLNRSMETWFNVKVDKALDRSLNLGYTAFYHSQNELIQQARLLANRMAENPHDRPWAILEEARSQISADEAALFTENGKVLHMSSLRPQLLPMLLDAKRLRDLRVTREYQATEARPGGLVLRVVTPVYPRTLTAPLQWLQLVKAVPPQLVADAALVEQVQGEYKQLALSRETLKLYYTVTLTLTLIIVLTGALALAFYLSRRLSEPLADLADGARAVAQGDYTRRQEVRGHDELGMLTQLFNRMTRQLGEASASVEIQQAQVESARAYLQTILSHISSGVFALDDKGFLRTSNPGASAILGFDCEPLLGLHLNEWAEEIPELALLAELIAGHLDADASWQIQTEFRTHQKNKHLLLHGAPLPDESGGCVILFDDISDLLQAQRTAAWGEVAKRLAHEIRNPLTPIQLSAERLQMKLVGKLPPAESELLERNIRTIINQVAALKGLVDAFRDYAKAPTFERKLIDLNTLMADTLTLYESQPGLKLELCTVPLTIQVDTNGLRQVIHNLLRNAQDAVTGMPSPEIRVRTECRGPFAVLEIEDNGLGFDQELLERAFEPYVTTKPKGSGLGLAIIKKIIDEHQGRITIGNCVPQGARIRIEWPLKA